MPMVTRDPRGNIFSTMYPSPLCTFFFLPCVGKQEIEFSTVAKYNGKESEKDQSKEKEIVSHLTSALLLKIIYLL